MQDQDSETYSLKLEGHGISISRDIRQEMARAILDIIMGGKMRARAEKSILVADDTHDDQSHPSLSLHEFLEKCGAKRNPDKITAIGHYVTEHEGRRGFNQDALKGRFREAGEAVPANFPRDFSWAVKNGWIAEDSHNRDSYYVTKKGRDAVEQNFSSEIRKRTAQKKGLYRKRRRNHEEKGGDE